MIKKTLLVMFGGISPEHEVSVITGIQVLNNLNKENYDVIPLYISKDGRWFTSEDFYNTETFKDLNVIPSTTEEVYLTSKPDGLLQIKKQGLFAKVKTVKIDVAFLCFHGGTGENGSLQGLLDVANIPYVGSSVLGSVLGMDKVVMKQVLQQNNISVAPYVYFYKRDWEGSKESLVERILQNLALPLYVKPANSGSSIGITKVTKNDDLENAIEVALAFDRKVIIEKGIEGFKEVNISVIGIAGEELITSEIEEVYTTSDFLNYEDKYVGDSGNSQGMASAKRKIPAELSDIARKNIKEKAMQAFTVLNASGLARIDFLVNNETGDYYLIEINTIPGSMSFYLWEAAQLPFRDMIDKLIEVAIKRSELENDKTTSFSSNILQNFQPSLKSPKLKP